MHVRPAFVLAATTLLLASCRDAQVSSYRVPAEKAEKLPPILTGEMPASAPAAAGGDAASMANTAVPTASGQALTWTAPAHWKTKPASAMRKGSYAVTGADGAEADLSITAFPGDVGGDLANINRWRGQISLPPLTAADLATSTEHLDLNGLHITYVDIANPTGEKPQRIVGAFVPFENATWFFKLMGPETVVAAERDAFRAFLSTVKPASAAQ
ncbi:MAG TPA: hypothetical protein VEQ65_12860 [Opitutus sp.]|nr:hypothetical protein [Opitutus sp.]